ncbi:ion channel [Geothermobacter hydrogeniphilus]|uniref:ion channel n=1 Tax=Geothermobacter hydrogeniphilus TaxID=1969733 RepID=UPI0013048B1A|nr:ion channel [Geothermobacter hydrogeniphilus]
MTTEFSRTRAAVSWYRHQRFLFLLVVLLVAIALSPLFDNMKLLGMLSDVFLTLVFLGGLWAVSRQRAILLTGVVLALPMLVYTWSVHFIHLYWLTLIGRSCGILFLLLLVVSILKFIFQSRRVTLELIHAAVVVYLLIGLCWTFIYGLIEVMHPGSFSHANPSSSSFAFSYFSFVTLTTLGYGDISPVAQVARSSAILEAIIGQLYLTVLVARLVGMQIAQGDAGED